METLRGTQENEPLRVPLRLFNIEVNTTDMKETKTDESVPETPVDENQLELF